MESFQRHVKGGHAREDVFHQLLAHAGPNGGIAKHAGIQRGEPAKTFFPERLGGLLEQPELVFGAEFGQETHGLGLGKDTLTGLAGRYSQRVAVGGLEIHQEQGAVPFPRDAALAGEVDGGVSVWIAGVPARDGHIHALIQLIGTVPAKDHIAEAKAAPGGALKLVQADVFSTQDTVDIKTADFDLVVSILPDRA